MTTRVALTGALFLACIIITWFAPSGWPIIIAVFAVVCSGLALVVALAPPMWTACPLCGFYTTNQRNHYRKVHDL